MSLAGIYTELLRRARETGEDRAQSLKGGARLAVRVRASTITLTISRKGKAVGDTELLTFKRDCNVPSDAERLPELGQRIRVLDGESYHTITYRWKEDE